MPARLLGEPVDHAEAQPGSLAGLLRGEERFEDFLADLFRDTGTGIAHGDHHVVSGLDATVDVGTLLQNDVAGFKRQLSAIDHGVAGVDCKVHQRRGELVCIDERRPDGRLQSQFELDMAAQCRAQQLGGLDHQRIDVGLLGLQRLLAGEGEQLARQFRASARRITDELGIGGQLRLVGDAFSQKTRCCR